MLIVGKRSLSNFLRILTDLILVLNILTLLLLPVVLTAIYENPELIVQLDRSADKTGPDIRLRSEYPADLPSASYPFYLVFLYASGIGTACILLQGHQILRRLERSEPFSHQQARSFRFMSFAFFLLTITFAVKIVFYNTLLTMFCCLLFLIFSLVCLIMADIFRQAYLVKSENELTI
jgi:hypothetical protein